MTPFARLDTVAAPLALANVDTDAIIPARYLKTVSRRGLGKDSSRRYARIPLSSSTANLGTGRGY